jgi:hypothetical protein
MDAATAVYDEVLKRSCPETALRMYSEAWRKTK